MSYFGEKRNGLIMTAKLSALLLLLTALSLAPQAHAQHCGHAEGEEVLERLERRFGAFFRSKTAANWLQT